MTLMVEHTKCVELEVLRVTITHPFPNVSNCDHLRRLDTDQIVEEVQKKEA